MILGLDLLLYFIVALILSAAIVWNSDPAFLLPDVPLDPMLLLLNTLPAAFLALFLLALTGRGWLSMLISMALLWVVYVVNGYKVDMLGTPILPSDFLFLGHLGDSGDLLARYVALNQWIWAGCVLVLLVLFGLFERRWQKLKGWPHVVAALGTTLLVCSLVFNLSPWSSLYAQKKEDFLAWSPAVTAEKNGLGATLLGYFWRFSNASHPVDHAAARQLLADFPLPGPGTAAESLPDIIVVQSESFFDPARLKGFDAESMLPEYRRLAAGHRHGDMWVPAFGGGTIRTEFEVLTGLAMREFPGVAYPYFSLTGPGSVPSLASTLSARGYETVAMHPNSRDFWNRATAFEHLGFDEFIAAEQFGADEERIGYYHSDAVLTDHVLERLEAAQRPIFLFAISIENHGPYDGYPNADPEQLAAQPLPAGVDGLAAERLRGYFLHLENADRELGRLVEALQKRTRRSLILFYGDHLPALPIVYEKLKFDDGMTAPMQPVPWVLIDTAKEATVSEAEVTASFYLPALLFNAAGIDDQDYFSLLEALRRADTPGPGWTPNRHEGMRAVMRLRQRNELQIGP